MNIRHASALAIALTALGCAGAQPGTKSSGAGPASWSERSPAERMSLMMNTVMPRMRDAFQTNDLALYANFNCASCHGAGAKDKTYKMPNPELTKLDPRDRFASNKDINAARYTFMTETVVPEMARLLGEPVFDPKTGKGFGCLECHVNKR
jgi:hypothetical protein